jgi:hypothetical protein
MVLQDVVKLYMSQALFELNPRGDKPVNEDISTLLVDLVSFGLQPYAASAAVELMYMDAVQQPIETMTIFPDGRAYDGIHTNVPSNGKIEVSYPLLGKFPIDLSFPHTIKENDYGLSIESTLKGVNTYQLTKQFSTTYLKKL